MTEAAVVVDTNFAGRRGRFSSRVLRRIMRVAERENTVIVPEVVLWEWASHAKDDLAALAKAVSDATTSLDPVLGFAHPAIAVPQVQEFIDRIRVQLDERGILVWPSSPAGAIDAIRAQVLQHGVGTIKDGVKTGAADGLILATLEDVAQRYARVVLATGDKVLAKEAAGHVEEVAANQLELMAWYATTTPASSEIVDAVADFLREALVANAGQERLDLLAAGTNLTGLSLPSVPQISEFLETEVDTIDIESLEVDRLELVQDDDLHLATAFVTGRGWVSATIWTYDSDWNLAALNNAFNVRYAAQLEVGMSEMWEPESAEIAETLELQVVD